jgi:hypothetical protein
MAAGFFGITIEKGATFALQFNILNSGNNTAFDLTGFTATSEIRVSPNSSNTLAIFTCQIASPPTQGIILITLPDATTASLPVGVYHWDLFVKQSSPQEQSIRLIKGTCEVVPTVTR